MKSYSVAEVRKELARALDIAETGEAVAIERRGVVFELRRRDVPRRVSRAPKLFELVDEAIASGEWHWTAPGPKMTVKAGRKNGHRRSRKT